MDSSAQLAGESADQALAALKNLPTLPQEWRSKVAIGISVLDTSLTPAMQVKYILQNEAAADLIYDWLPAGVLAICSRIVSKPDQLQLASYDLDTFRKALELLVESGHQINFVAYAIAVDFPGFGVRCSVFGVWAASRFWFGKQLFGCLW